MSPVFEPVQAQRVFVRQNNDMVVSDVFDKQDQGIRTMSGRTNTAALSGEPTPMTPDRSHREIQGVLRDEIETLQGMLEARFREIVMLTEILETAETAQTAEDKRKVETLEHRHSVELSLLRAHMSNAANDAPKVGVLPFAKQLTALVRAQVSNTANGPGAGVLPFAKQLAMLETAELFNAAWYLETYPDIASVGISPKEHYVRSGAFEGRNPGPDFDTMAYYFANPDVAASGWPALVHYVLFGQKEGRALA